MARAEVSAPEALRLREQGFATATPGIVQVESVTDVGGRCLFDGMLPTTYQLHFQASSFVFCRTQEISLESGESKELSLNVCWSHALSGCITDAATGRPIPSAVVVIDAIHASNIPEARVEHGGHRAYVFPADPLGQYSTGPGLVVDRSKSTDPLRAHAMAPGYATRSMWLRSDRFEERQGRLDFKLDPEFRATIIAHDIAGTPLQGVSFGMPLGGPYETLFRLYSPSCVSDESGRILLERLAPERYIVTLAHEKCIPTHVTLEQSRPRDVFVDVTLHPQVAPVRGRIIFDPAVPEGSRNLRMLRVWLEKLDGATAELNPTKHKLPELPERARRMGLIT